MVAFLAPLAGLLLSVAGSLVGRVLLALGIGYVTYKGFDLSVSWLLVQIKGNMGAMPVEVVSLMGYLWVDKAISLIFSAYSAALLVKLAGKADLTQMVTKGA
jgi:hypothetical protein